MGQAEVGAWSQGARVSAPVGLGLGFLKGTLFRKRGGSSSAPCLSSCSATAQDCSSLNLPGCPNEEVLKSFLETRERAEEFTQSLATLGPHLLCIFLLDKNPWPDGHLLFAFFRSPHEGWGNLRCLSAQLHLYLETKLGGSSNLLLNASGNSKGERRSIAPHMGKHLILLTQLGSEGPSRPPISCIFSLLPLQFPHTLTHTLGLDGSPHVSLSIPEKGQREAVVL